jgi:hypothetical protein
MSALVIIVTDISSSDGTVLVSGRAYTQLGTGLKTPDNEDIPAGGCGAINWVASCGWGDSATAINTAIKDAAIAAAAVAGYTVGGADKKTLFRGALDL